MNRKLAIVAVLGSIGLCLTYGFESIPVQIFGTALLGLGVLLSQQKEGKNEGR